MPTLVLLRHGQSTWNLANRYTGWWDVDLSDEGIAEAHAAGEAIRDRGVQLDYCYTSVLTRAVHTVHIVLRECGQLWVPVNKHWRLNELHCGSLTGLNKDETAAKFGAEQVQVWRRSFDEAAPPLAPESQFGTASDRRYEGMTIPTTESFRDTLARVKQHWDATIAPKIRSSSVVLICAHGNSLRAIEMLLRELCEEDVARLEIATGQPIVYELDGMLAVRDRNLLTI